jgi:hypothetical protein
MNILSNLQALTQTSFDSGSLGGLGTVVHRMQQTGDHQVKVLQADKLLQTFSLHVVAATAQPAAGPASAGAAPGQVQVDLSRAVASLGQLATSGIDDLQLAASGYAVFHAPPGVTGFAVQLQAPGAPDKPPVFDSRQLQNGDIFAATLFRPGRYTLANSQGGAKGEVRVSYPVISDTPYVPPDPAQVQVTAQGFQPASIQLKPAQGLVFHVANTSARIQIALAEPDDGPVKPAPGPAPSRRPEHRWEKPAPPDTK